jgi:cytochrome c-type biogenesis protein CcmH/NrfG
MISFLTLATLLAVLASAFIVPALWREAPNGATGKSEKPQRWTAVWLVTALVFITAALYIAVGSPRAFEPHDAPLIEAGSAADGAPEAANESSGGPQSNGAAPAMTQAQIEGMVDRLAQRLHTQPNDPQGWRMLARSYETLGRFPQAVHAYQELLKQSPPDADLLTDYAVTLGMSLNQTLIGEPEAVINQALKLNPNHIQALALSGSAAFEKQDYRQAIAQWTKLLSVVPADADMRPSIERNIAKARSLADGAVDKPTSARE